ncbi:MAG: hypothetical protein HYY24_06495 [Verrucomicrobia bacterium]|nr:hypothetical protein [Verrucomicrobiota bacterium]
MKTAHPDEESQKPLRATGAACCSHGAEGQRYLDPLPGLISSSQPGSARYLGQVMSQRPAEEQRSRLEEFQRRHSTKLATLLFTDIVDSGALKQQHGDSGAVALIQRHHELVRELLRRFPEANEINTAGDSFLLEFATPSDAVKFALLLQARLRSLAKETGKPVLDRIGVNLGEVVIEEGAASGKGRDFHGTEVDLCNRVMKLAEGGQILLTRPASDSSRQMLKGQEPNGISKLFWKRHGLYAVAGVEAPVEICEVGDALVRRPKAPKGSEKAKPVNLTLSQMLGPHVIVPATLLLILAGVFAWHWQQRRDLPGAVAEAVLRELSRQGATPRTALDSTTSLDFQSAFRGVAEQFNITPDQAERVVRQWADEKRTSTDLSRRAQAEFLQQRFVEAAALSDQAAAKNLARAKQLMAERGQLLAGAAADFLCAAQALREAGDLTGSLDRVLKASAVLTKDESPSGWAKVQNWLGIANAELGTRIEGITSREHLSAAIVAFRQAADTFTREQ